MTDQRLAALEQEISRLRAEVADVRKAIKAESDNTTTHVVKLYKDIKSTNERIISICENVSRHSDWLTTIIYKFMPEHKAARDQIDSIFSASDDSSNPHNPA